MDDFQQNKKNIGLQIKESVKKEARNQIPSIGYFFNKGELDTEKVNDLSKWDMLKDWRFPYEKIRKDSKVIIYSAGKVGQSFINQLKYTNYCKVVAWVDTYNKGEGKGIVSPKHIMDLEFDYVIIANSKEELINEIKDYLQDLNINEDCIVTLF